VQWGGHTYLLTSRATNYWEAERQAVAVGGHLVSITSQAEQDWVFSTFLSRRGRTFWIGLAREYNGGPFQRWASGERYGFSAWNRGEPNNWGGNEQCTHILDNNRWNDLPCKYALQGIIEIDSTSTSLGSDIRSASFCIDLSINLLFSHMRLICCSVRRRVQLSPLCINLTSGDFR
jgi:hypothetical protein